MGRKDLAGPSPFDFAQGESADSAAQDDVLKKDDEARNVLPLFLP
jgi:hypothetical protein